MNGPPANHRGWCSGSYQHQRFLCILLFVVVFFIYGSEIVSNWSPEQWMKNQSRTLQVIYESQRSFVSSSSSINSDDTHKSENTLSAANATRFLGNVTQIAADDNAAVAAPGVAPLTTNTNLSASPQTKTHAAVTTQMKTATVWPTPVPYVSPGPYLVEYPQKYHFLVNEPLRCEQEKPFLVLVVPVAPGNRAHRDNIRQTWGSESLVLGKTVTLFFLLGLRGGVEEDLLQESKEHHDLIQSDFLDCYKNLTIKTMVMLEWLNSYCSGASFAMKVDSDMFLNVEKLMSMLLKAPKCNYMTGRVESNAMVRRNPQSKWYLPPEIYPKLEYPRYALGLGYILSLDLPKKLIEASQHLKAFYIEDVYLGLCMEYLGIPPTDPPSWDYFHFIPVEYSGCRYTKIVATTIGPLKDVVQLWKDFKKAAPHC